MSDKSSVRDELLRLAITVIDAEGEAGVRINNLVEAAGVTPPTLYHYFGSREGLIIEAQTERFVRQITADLNALRGPIRAVTTAHQTREIVDLILETLWNDERRSTRALRHNVLGSAITREALANRLAEAQAHVHREFVELFRPLQEAGFIRADLNLLTAMYWVAGVLTSRFLIEIGTNDADPKAWNEMTRVAVRYLFLGSPQE